MTHRYPFPIPFGWFCVGTLEEFLVSEARLLYYWGRHLVGWRDTTGAFHLQDAFCPTSAPTSATGERSSGARSAARSTAGSSTPRAPTRPSPTASGQPQGPARTYPTLECNGVVLAWYHPDDEPPMWTSPRSPSSTAIPSGP